MQRNATLQVSKPSTAQNTPHSQHVNTSVVMSRSFIGDTESTQTLVYVTSGKTVPMLDQSNSSANVYPALSSYIGFPARETRLSCFQPVQSDISLNHLFFDYHMYRSVEKPVFESDACVLKNSREYQKLLQTYITLLAQRTQAIRDIDKLENLKLSAVKHPAKFIGKLQNGEMVFPRRQKIVGAAHDFELT